MKGAAATKVASSITKVRKMLADVQARGIQVQTAERELLEQLDTQIKAHLPTQSANDSDNDGDYY